MSRQFIRTYARASFSLKSLATTVHIPYFLVPNGVGLPSLLVMEMCPSGLNMTSQWWYGDSSGMARLGRGAVRCERRSPARLGRRALV